MISNPGTTWLATAKQRAPVPNDRDCVPVTSILGIGPDLLARARMGSEQYGTRLQPHNGRDALVDAYQEALDLVMYLRQGVMEGCATSMHLSPIVEGIANVMRRRLQHEHGEHREDWERLYTEDN